ncbi:MAG: nucleotide-binding protein [Candidatus ainarchaeum sp.]|nr:nucleotide-binding protein [Candidatus ainarchaeum sp.]
MVRRVWLDANFLMLPAQFKVDIFAELERVIEEPFELLAPSGVLGELGNVSAGRGIDAAAARVALKIAGSGRVKIVQSEGPVDDWLAEKAGEGDVVCTNDLGLIRRLRGRKVRRVQMVGRSHLGFAR